jgi:ferredoxin
MKKPKSKKKKKRRRSFALPPERKQKRKHVWLKVLPDDLWLKVRRGKTILEALQKTDVELEGDCGGLGQCGKCKVKRLGRSSPSMSASLRPRIPIIRFLKRAGGHFSISILCWKSSWLACPRTLTMEDLLISSGSDWQWDLTMTI